MSRPQDTEKIATWLGISSEGFDPWNNEAANAMVLEKILSLPDTSVHMMWRDGKFQLTVFYPNRPTPSGFDGGEDYKAENKRTAICAAALKLIEVENARSVVDDATRV